jgi:hypothetical protein
MKKVVLASLLAVAGAISSASLSFAQATGSGIQMSADEYAAYNNANTQGNCAAKATAFEAYLKAYPNSAVKVDVLSQILFCDTQGADEATTLSAADRLLAVDPGNLRALAVEVYYKRLDGDKLTDPAAKTAALDQMAVYAQKGLNATAPKDTTPADFAKIKATTAPTFYSAIADDDLAKKASATDPDPIKQAAAIKQASADAITALKAEIDGDEPDTEKASQVLQDVYTLAQAYYTSTPPDYLDCAWYATRAAFFAPDAYKPTIQPVATYCYKKFHGGVDGYDAMQTAVKTNLDPPAGFLATIKPAPKPSDYVAQLVATTPDLGVLAISDREFALQYGTQIDPKSGTADATTGKIDPATQKTDAQEVFDAVKGKSVQLPDVLVVAATADSVQVAVSDDSVQAKPPVADFTFTMKEPLPATGKPGEAVIPKVGDKITIDGTYASYTSNPLMITMSDAVIIPKKVEPVHRPVHHTAPHH